MKTTGPPTNVIRDVLSLYISPLLIDGVLLQSALLAVSHAQVTMNSTPEVSLTGCCLG